MSMIVFTHVPKTSGTSFRKSLVEPNLPPERIYKYAGARRFLRDRGNGRAFVWGHVPYGLHAIAGQEVGYVTFLRDPVDRAVSYYYFVKDSDPALYKHPARDEADALSIVEFFSLPKYRNWQARYLAGLPYHYLYRRLPSARLDRIVLERALDNLSRRYLCFGLQERFEDSLDVFQARLGWRHRVSVSRQKKTGTRPALAEVDAATRAVLGELNRLDCRLYEIATENFEARRR